MYTDDFDDEEEEEEEGWGASAAGTLAPANRPLAYDYSESINTSVPSIAGSTLYPQSASSGGEEYGDEDDDENSVMAQLAAASARASSRRAAAATSTTEDRAVTATNATAVAGDLFAELNKRHRAELRGFAVARRALLPPRPWSAAPRRGPVVRRVPITETASREKENEHENRRGG